MVEMLLKNLFWAVVPLIAKDGFGGELEESIEAISLSLSLSLSLSFVSQCKERTGGGGAYGVMVFFVWG